MSIVLRMLHKNVPLSQHETFKDEGNGFGFYAGGKHADKDARAIVNQLCHPKVVELIFREMQELPEHMRIQIRTIASTEGLSGNVRKGIQRLDVMMGGGLLREKKFVQMTTRRVEGVDGVRYKKGAVNPAIAGATRKYGTR